MTMMVVHHRRLCKPPYVRSGMPLLLLPNIDSDSELSVSVAWYSELAAFTVIPRVVVSNHGI
jgi:hypothetical protein